MDPAGRGQSKLSRQLLPASPDLGRRLHQPCHPVPRPDRGRGQPFGGGRPSLRFKEWLLTGPKGQAADDWPGIEVPVIAQAVENARERVARDRTSDPKGSAMAAKPGRLPPGRRRTSAPTGLQPVTHLIIIFRAVPGPFLLKKGLSFQRVGGIIHLILDLFFFPFNALETQSIKCRKKRLP